MTTPICPTCQRRPNPARWECARIECPNRKARMWVPDSVHHEGFESVVSNEPNSESFGTYRRQPRFEE